MLPLLLLACDVVQGPHTALAEAKDAFQRHDLVAFEAVVDLDAIAPAAFQLCYVGAMRKDAVDREFTGGNVLKDLAPALGEAFWLAAAQHGGAEIADQVRAEFPTLNLSERCAEVKLGEPTAGELFSARRSGALKLPATVAGIPVEVPLRFAEQDGRWRLTGMDVQPTLSTLDAALAAEAHRRAMALLERARKGEPDAWSGLRHYTARHPEDAEVARAFEAAAAPLLAAKTPAQVASVDFSQAGILGMKRVLVAEVKNDGDKGLVKYVVRFQLLDSQSKPVSGATGLDSALAEGGALGAGAEGEVEVMLQALNYPGVAQATATVVRATFEDGSTWEHPAITAGLW